MEYKLQDLIDIPLFQTLLDKLNEIYTYPSAIIDNDGNILTATAWQDVCTKFHRANKESEKECIKSDQYIASHLNEANPYVCYKCPHGLVDNVIPIIINEKHIANFFTGQIFLEQPDLNFFKEQATKYDFNEKSYLEAVGKVPVWSRENLDKYLDFIKTFTEMIAGMGYKNLKEIENSKLIVLKNQELLASEEEIRASVEELLSTSEALKISNQELRVAKENAEESDILKTAFLENISHEVRTPMNAILGFSELLLKPNLEVEKQKIFKENLHDSTRELLAIVDNIVTLAHIEANQVRIRKIDFCPKEFLENLQEEYNNKKILSEKNHIQLVLDVPKSAVSTINSDYVRLSQVFTILLDNAFKFTENGSVTLGLKKDKNNICFYVKDTGIGIHENKQKIIFKSFMQANKEIRQNYGGLGVGLSIAKGLVKLLGGEITMSSKENAGTEIVIILQQN